MGVESIGPSPNASELFFTAGGNQGGEGADYADEWFIENVAEELDAPNEYYYDSATRELRLIYNGTTAAAAATDAATITSTDRERRPSGSSSSSPPASGSPPGFGSPPSSVEVPVLTNLFELRGSRDAPVRHVSLRGLTLRDTRPSYLEPRGNPSGGDWALERLGALLLEGTEGFSVEGCTFSRLDSNGIMLSGYNRNATIRDNEFIWLGQSAIAAWGRLEGESNRGLSGDQPRGTLVEANVCHEIGSIQKQSSFYFQAVAAQTTLRANVVFNIPRAAVNFNDGFGGANVLVRNLLFNTCRESSDHGAFNSWDRLPYVTTLGDGQTPSTVPAVTDVHHNLIVANYGADGGCLDNDDGTSYYDIHANVCYYGGHKSDFDGHSKRSFGNLHIHPSVYGVKCVGELQALPKKGYAEGYFNNTCILPGGKDGSTYLKLANCPGNLRNDSAAVEELEDGITLGNNTVYIPGGSATVACGPLTVDAQTFFQRGYDAGTSVVKEAPSVPTIVAWAKALLSL